MNKLDQAINQTNKKIGINVDKDLSHKIKQWDSQGIFYGIFPTVGDSMTCDDSRNIPNGSHVLVNQIKKDSFLMLPTNKPLLIEIKGIWHKSQFICKTISFIDDVTKQVRLTSYNPKHKDVLIPYAEIGRIFKVQKIFLPNTLTT